ncbi:MAG: acyl-[acyl-carrier-protein]--UDP-N-acetylglucosamine O-acyltransferase, partial [Oricola sp.]|nr:acyl-[acyl-carrier-protein]--UDP-N-acetylglucosamine O-acyltransferase [Oricola sp.]
ADVIPFGMIMGNRGYLAGLNLVGMKRSGMGKREINALRHTFKDLFSGVDGSLRENAARLIADNPGSEGIRDIADFILADSRRKFMTPISASNGRLETGD